MDTLSNLINEYKSEIEANYEYLSLQKKSKQDENPSSSKLNNLKIKNSDITLSELKERIEKKKQEFKKLKTSSKDKPKNKKKKKN